MQVKIGIRFHRAEITYFEIDIYEIYFSEKNPGIFRFVTLPLEIPEKTSFHPRKFCKIVTLPGNF